MGGTQSDAVALFRAFQLEFPGTDALSHAVRAVFQPPPRPFPEEEERMALWLMEHVPQRCQMAVRFPATARRRGALSHDDIRITEWIRTGRFFPDLEDPIPDVSRIERRLSSLVGMRFITEEEERDHWWLPEHLSGPIRQLHQSLTWYVYVLGQGTKVYHGTHGRLTPGEVLERNNFFGDWIMARNIFAQTYHESHQDGGQVMQFVTTQPLFLLAVDHSQTLDTLLRVLQPDETLFRRFQTAFPFALHGSDWAMTRQYGSGNDVPLFGAVCSRLLSEGLPLHGTASCWMMQEGDVWRPPVVRLPSEGVGHGGVPPEMFLCQPKDCLSFRSVVTPFPSRTHRRRRDRSISPSSS